MATQERYEFDELKAMCAGRWQEIITALSRVDVSEAIAKLGRHVKCPANDHGNTRQQFRLFKDFHETGGGICNTCGSYPNGFLLLTYLNGYEAKEAVKEVAQYLREKEIPARPKVQAPQAKPVFEVDSKKVDDLKAVWAESLPLAGSIAERYLRDRGITCALPDDAEVRFHPALEYFSGDGKLEGSYPAMVSLLRSCEKGYPLSIHRTYLDPAGGKAKVTVPKKLMSVPIEHAISELGGAIRLFPVAGDELAVTEGIETALAVRSQYPNLPVWATYSAMVLTKFRPPKGIRKVYIFGDVDSGGAGQAAAVTLAMRLYDEGIQSAIRLPLSDVALPAASAGWYNDKLTREAMARRLNVDGYHVTEACSSKDHLDSLVEQQKLKRRQSA